MASYAESGEKMGQLSVKYSCKYSHTVVMSLSLLLPTPPALSL